VLEPVPLLVLQSAIPLFDPEAAMAKTTMRRSKSMTGKDGGRKLAAGAGRAKHKSAGEPQRETKDPRDARPRTGSSKQRKP
jgi:hypothetical protein